MNKEYINRISKYFYHFITKIKIKKSKEDSRKLKELELALSKAEEEREIAYNKYSKLLDKTIIIIASNNNHSTSTSHTPNNPRIATNYCKVITTAG